MIQLIILDRDGVINYDSPDFIKSPQEWHPIPGSLEAIAQLNQAGFKVCVATNQSGIARGYFSLATLSEIHEKMLSCLKTVGGHLDAVFFCPHAAQEHCLCRKPEPGLYRQALNYFKVTPEEAFVMGDSLRDIEAAQKAGCQSAMVKSNKQITPPPGIPIYANLSEAVSKLLNPTHD